MLFPAAVIVFLFLALGVGTVFVVGAPVFAIPIFLLLALGAVATLVMGRTVLRRQGQYRRMRRFRSQARAEPAPVTAEDRRTLV